MFIVSHIWKVFVCGGGGGYCGLVIMPHLSNLQNIQSGDNAGKQYEPNMDPPVTAP